MTDRPHLRGILGTATCAVLLALACAACGAQSPSRTARASFPDTRAGAQARWLLAEMQHAPIPAGEIEKHFDGTFLTQVSPDAINSGFAGLAPVRFVSVGASAASEIVFTVQAGGPKAPSPRLQVVLEVDAEGLIGTLGLQPAPAPGSTVPASLIGGGCLMPSSAKAPLCYSPQAIREAYGLVPLVARGSDGQGRTVAIIDIGLPGGTPGATNPLQDLSAYDRYFHLPPADLQIVTRFDPQAAPAVASGEEAGDIETVHAIAPGAAIRVVLVPTAPGSNLGQEIATTWLPAWNYAIGNADVVSFSGGAGEQCFTAADITALHSVFEAAAARHITVIASSGDTGPVSGCTTSLRAGAGAGRDVSYPASDPLVLSAGGTSLSADPATGAYRTESAWAGASTSFELASGGGPSQVFSRPSYQNGIPGTGPHRAIPDVSADADLTRGVAIMTVTASGLQAVGPGGGTSAAAPMWAGLVAIADQFAHRDLGFVNPALYTIGKSAQYDKAFHDVTRGDTTIQTPSGPITGYDARPGWDMATGWGSPSASVLVPLLADYDKS